MTATVLIALFLVLPALALAFGRDSRTAGRGTEWPSGSRARRT